MRAFDQIMQRLASSALSERSGEIGEILNGERTARFGIPVAVERAESGTKAPNGAEYHIRIVASTAGVARDGGLVPLKAWGAGGLKNFRANPVIQPFHDYSQLPVARSVHTELDKERDAMVQYWLFHEQTELSRQMKTLYESGFMRAASVGFIVHEAEYISLEEEAKLQKEYGTKDPIYWRALRAELLETSAVPVPADAGALMIKNAFRNADAAGIDFAAVRAAFEGSNITVRTDVDNPETPAAPAASAATTAPEAVVEPTALDRALERMEQIAARFESAMERLAQAPEAREAPNTETVEETATPPAAPVEETVRDADADPVVQIEKRDGETDEEAAARYVDELIAAAQAKL